MVHTHKGVPGRIHGCLSALFSSRRPNSSEALVEIEELGRGGQTKTKGFRSRVMALGRSLRLHPGS
jgi:hypothetical protein